MAANPGALRVLLMQPKKSQIHPRLDGRYQTALISSFCQTEELKSHKSGIGGTCYTQVWGKCK